MKRSLCLVAAFMLFMPIFSFAKNSMVPDTQALILKTTDNHVKILQEFSSIGNLIGFVVEKEGNSADRAVLYGDKDGQYFFVGGLFNAEGENQTQLDTDKYVSSIVATKAYDAASKTAWVLDGSAGAKHTMYILGDPNCTYCRKLYSMTRPYVKSGDLAIRWIWVGYLRPTSEGLALAILGSDDPEAAMAKNEKRTPSSDEGLKPIDKPSNELKQKLAKNMAFMSTFNFPGTPAIIYQDQQGQAHMSYGLPVADGGLPGLIDRL